MIGETTSVLKLDNFPGGATTFESIAKVCYGVKLELTSANVVPLRCASEYLSMTEECIEGNLMKQSDDFLNQVVLNTWNGSIQALHTCLRFTPYAEKLNIVDNCIESLALKAGDANPKPDADILSWPTDRRPLQSPGGSILWNGIGTGARLRKHRLNSNSNWWYEDVTSLKLQIYTRLLSRMASIGTITKEMVAGSLVCYAKTYLPVLNLNKRFRNSGSNSNGMLSEDEQRALVSEFVRLLPPGKGLVPTKILFGMLRTAMILRSSEDCKLDLEKRIGLQLETATLEDLLLPNYVEYTMEPLYNIDSIDRILQAFFGSCKETESFSPVIASVAKLIDGYLAEVGSDANLKPTKFISLAAAIPTHARHLDDGIYRAVDVYLKAHPWLSDVEREWLCRLMDCQKLSLEACTHAAQNERLPLRVVVQVLFFEQIQLRGSIAECYLMTSNDNLDAAGTTSRPLPPTDRDNSSELIENNILKSGIDKMRTRVFQLEKVCTNLKKEIARLSNNNYQHEKQRKPQRKPPPAERTNKASRIWSRRFGFTLKPQFCSTEQNSVHETKSEKNSAWKKNK